jgi:hypothetical protein
MGERDGGRSCGCQDSECKPSSEEVRDNAGQWAIRVFKKPYSDAAFGSSGNAKDTGSWDIEYTRRSERRRESEVIPR